MKNLLNKLMMSTKYFAAMFALLALLMVGGNSWGQTNTVVPFPANGTWICPTGVTSIQVEAWSGGGGGSGAGGNAKVYSGGGGAGGNYARQTAVPVTPGQIYDVTIGAGGTAGSKAPQIGGNGGTTSFVAQTGSVTLLSITGGTGGNGGSIAYKSGLVVKNGGSIVNISTPSTAGGYSAAPTVVIGTPWAATTACIVDQQLSSGGNLYTVTTAGTTGTASPTHTSASVTNGTAVLAYAGVAATATANLSGTTPYPISYIQITNSGIGYKVAPAISFTGGTTTLSTGSVASVSGITVTFNPLTIVNTGAVGTLFTALGGNGGLGFYSLSTLTLNASGAGGGAAGSSGPGSPATAATSAGAAGVGGVGATGGSAGANGVVSSSTASFNTPGINATGIGGGGGGATGVTSAIGGAGAPGHLIITYTPPAIPTITLSTASINGFSAKTTEVSASKTFTVAGTYLTDDISLTANSDFELSTNGTSFTSPIVISKSIGSATISPTTIYVRMKSGVGGGIYSSTTAITATSTGATNGTITCSGFVTTPYYYKGTGSLTTATNWVNSTGTEAQNFSSDYQLFVIKNTTAVSTDAQWTVSGTESKIIVGDPSSPGVTLTVDSIVGTYYGVNGTIDLAEASIGSNKLVTKIKLQSIAATAWTASTTYTLNQVVTNGGNAYTVTTAGTSGTVSPTHTKDAVAATSGTAILTYSSLPAATAWTASSTYTLNQQVHYLGNLYIVTTAGTSGTAAPIHTTGAVAATSGAATLTYSAPYTGTITFGSLHSSSEVNFQASAGSWGGNTSFGKVIFGNNSSSTLIVPLIVQTSLNLESGSTITVNSTSYLYFNTGATATIAGKISSSRATGMFAFSIASPNTTNQALQFQGAEIVGTSLNLTGSTIEYSKGASSTTQVITPRTDYSNLVISDGTSVGINFKSISGQVSISDTLKLINKMGNNSIVGAANITLANGATIVRTAGNLDAAPIIANGSAVNVIYNGSTAITSGFEIPTDAAKLKSLTINNMAGVSLGATAWTANATYTLNQQVFYLGNLYSVTVIGTSGNAAPTHTSGAITATGGSAELTFSTQYAPLAWSASATYYLNQLVFNGSNLYFVNTAGTSGTSAPTHTTGSPSSGTAKLTYLSNYLGLNTVLGPVSWTANTTYTINQPIFYGVNLYTANVAGTSGTTEPVHTSGVVAATSGTASLTYVAPYTGTTINGTLTLTSGKLTLPTAGILRIASGNAIVGGSSTNYIVADSSAVVRMDAIASARMLPIGNTTKYLPITITPASTESLNIKVFEGITANGASTGTALGASQKTSVVNAVWNISQVGAAAATNSSVKVEWPESLEGTVFKAADAADLGLISNSGTGEWTLPIGSVDKTNRSATATVTSFGSFSAGRTAMLFAQPATKTYGDADFSAGVTSLNTSAITYVSNNLTVATVNAVGSIHIVGAGTATITASQITDGVYAAVSISRTLTVDKAALTITADDQQKFLLAVNPTLTATYTGFKFGETEAVLLTPLVLTTTAVTSSVKGSYPITGSGATAANYSISFVDGSLRVLNAAFEFDAIPVKTFGDADFDGGAFSVNTITPIEYVSDNTAVATIVSGKIHIVSAGTANITASQQGSGVYPTYTITQPLTVNKAPMTISFAALPSKVYGDVDFSPTATSSNSDLSIVYSSSNASVANIVAGKIHIVGAGSSIITASQAGNDNYASATSIDQALTIDKAALSITADNKSKYVGQDNPALTYVSAGFVLGETATVLLTPIEISTTAVTASAVGTYPITVSGATAVNYTISLVDATLTVKEKEIQTITFEAPATKTYGNADFAAGGSSSNASIAVVYSSSNKAVATIVGSNIHIVGTGTTDITASQAGSDVYEAATSVVRTLTVSKAALKIKADNKSKITEFANPVLTVSYEGFALGETSAVLLTPTVISTTAVTASLPGVYPITASAATAANYSISFVAGNLTVNPKKDQKISFAATAVKNYGNADFAAGATSTNTSIPILYTSSNQRVATIIGNMIHITGAGTAIITASQPSDSFYYAAKSIAQALTVNRVPLTVKAKDTTKIQGEDNPVFAFSYTGLVAGETGANLMAMGSTSAVKGSAAGYYTISVNGADTSNYIITYVSGRLTIYPPGGKDQINLNAYQSSSSQLTLRVFSLKYTFGDATLYKMDGTPIKKMSLDIPRGFSNTKMDLPFLLPGLYIITVKGRFVDCKKVISIL